MRGRVVFAVGLLAAAVAVGPGPAEAEYSGLTFRGVYGFQAARQRGPGFYVPVV